MSEVLPWQPGEKVWTTAYLAFMEPLGELALQSSRTSAAHEAWRRARALHQPALGLRPQREELLRISEGLRLRLQLQPVPADVEHAVLGTGRRQLPPQLAGLAAIVVGCGRLQRGQVDHRDVYAANRRAAVHCCGRQCAHQLTCEQSRRR